MKTIIGFFIITFTFFLFFVSSVSISQEDAYLTHNCPMDNAVYNGIVFPVKPPVTGDNYMRILIVYVMFDGESFDPGNTEWPANTSTGPSYKGTMLAQNKNSISDWWNAYNSGTQSVSSWFCENSRGQTHIIGAEYFVKLNTVSYYMRTYSTPALRENAINIEIYNNLTAQNVVWSNYDNWTYNVNTGDYSWGYDYNIDMIYKVHRYKYPDIFSEDDASGYAYLGRGSNTNDEWDYQITQGGQIYHVLGGFPSYTYSDKDGSGLTVVGNGTSGVLTKFGAFGRLMHENGHWLLGPYHQNIGMMGEVWEYSYSPFEKMMLGYAGSYVSNYLNNGYEEVTLDDISGRGTGNYLLRVALPAGDEFLLASRYKVSPWDRMMLGDTAYGYRTEVNYGQGTYIYHNAGGNNFPNTSMDIECADGLWKWVQNGYDAPDWDPYTPWLCVLNKTDPVRDVNDNGMGVNINGSPNAAKDGLNVRGTATNNHDCQKWFSVGKKKSGSLDGIDRIFTNTIENWTSREFQVDRWDSWRPKDPANETEEIGINEIFSPYSSPSTKAWNSQYPNTGTFIWISGHNNQTNQTTVKIYRDATYNTGGMTESNILLATPPSRPMGLKLEYTECYADVKNPVLKWTHNTEPDMIFYNNNIAYKKYKIYRAVGNYNDDPPGNYTLIKTEDILASEPNPSYTDIDILVDCSVAGQLADYVIRYFIKAVDNTNWASVPSDFVATDAKDFKNQGDNLTGNINNGTIPTTYRLYQNYPNPFNPVTIIQYSIPKDGKVILKIYDISGREVKSLVNNFQSAGNYSIRFNGAELSSGVFFYRITAGDFTLTKRMVLIK